MAFAELFRFCEGSTMVIQVLDGSASLFMFHQDSVIVLQGVCNSY